MTALPNVLPAQQPGQPCPCGSGQNFDACCQPALADTRPPATAEALMRSHFTAHVARDWAYLHRTYGPTGQHAGSRQKNMNPHPEGAMRVTQVGNSSQQSGVHGLARLIRELFRPNRLRLPDEELAGQIQPARTRMRAPAH